MERSKAALSHFGGIIRLVILIVLIAIITLFAVSFIRNRQNTKSAEQASQGVGSEEGNATTDSTDSSDDSTAQDVDSDESSEATIPSGVSDSDLPPTVASNGIPAAGMGADIALTATILTIIAFLYTKNRQLVIELQQTV